MKADVAIQLVCDDDVLRLEPYLDDGKGNGWYARKDNQGRLIRSWANYHQLAMNELDRRFRSRRSTGEPFEFGRLSLRAQKYLKDAAVALSLHFIFMAADRPGDTFYAMRAQWYWERASNIIEAEQAQLDYDLDNDGSFTEDEKNSPFSGRVIRG